MRILFQKILRCFYIWIPVCFSFLVEKRTLHASDKFFLRHFFAVLIHRIIFLQIFNFSNRNRAVDLDLHSFSLLKGNIWGEKLKKIQGKWKKCFNAIIKYELNVDKLHCIGITFGQSFLSFSTLHKVICYKFC